MPIFEADEADGWRYGQVEDGSVHVEPVGDQIGHEVRDCVCVPMLEPVKLDDGSVVWMVVHQSLDNRERQEAA